MKSINNAIGPQIRKKNTKKNHKMKLVALISLFLGLQVSTQFFAYLFHYDPLLGKSLINIYYPWEIICWWLEWSKEFYPQLVQSVSLGLFIAGIGLFYCIYNHSFKSQQINQYLHGSARWADINDLKRASILGNKAGVYIGGWIDSKNNFHYLRHNGPEHILTYAPTRSGKGLGLVIPTLLSWPHSVLVTDLKGELWALTSGWRQKHANNKVILFEPGSVYSACLNLFEEIRIGTEYEVGDVQNMATLIVDPDGKGLESHWQKSAYSLLVGLIIHAIYKSKHDGFTASLTDLDQMIADPKKSFHALLMEMLDYEHTDGKNHPIVGASARDMLDRTEEEGRGILSTAKSFLSLYRDPIIAKNISSSDFRIQDLMNHDSPVSLYISTQPIDKDRLKPLIRLVLSMILRIVAKRIEFDREPIPKSNLGIFKKIFGKKNISNTQIIARKNYKHRLLCMIDEFPALGKLDIVQECLSFIAGYGVKFYLICQDINQLKCRDEGYGPDEKITSNCHIQNAYPPNRIETAKHLSSFIGTTTVIKEQITTSGKKFGPFLGQISRTQQEVQRPLLTDDECLRMPGPIKDKYGQILEAGDMLIYVNGIPMVYGKQSLYFQDPVFVARASVEQPKATDRLRHNFKDRIKL